MPSILHDPAKNTHRGRRPSVQPLRGTADVTCDRLILRGQASFLFATQLSLYGRKAKMTPSLPISILAPLIT